MPKKTHILSTMASSLIGVAYFAYISNVDFPPGVVRIVPFAWLLCAIAGIIFGLRSLRDGGSRHVGIPVIVVAIANMLFAGIFSLAALMGD